MIKYQYSKYYKTVIRLQLDLTFVKWVYTRSGNQILNVIMYLHSASSSWCHEKKGALESRRSSHFSNPFSCRLLSPAARYTATWHSRWTCPCRSPPGLAFALSSPRARAEQKSKQRREREGHALWCQKRGQATFSPLFLKGFLAARNSNKVTPRVK